MDLFLYGTLRDDILRGLIGGAGLTAVPSTLPDHRVDRVADTQLPMLVRARGDRCDGLLLTGLTVDQIARFDAYELPFGYTRATVPTSDGEAQVYYPPEGQPSSGEDWSLADWQATDGPVSRLAAAEIAAHQPPLSGDALARQWHQIRSRAFSHQRGADTQRPTDIRREAGRAQIDATHALHGNFFKFRSATLQHERFDGGMSGPLPREALVAFDAALMLPYDPKRDRVLLLEQFRTGPFLRHDPNPWMLEPVAGLVDAGETPLQAIRREAVEEAGLHVHDIRPMFSCYPSPGNSTEYFHCYVGVCDLPDDLPRMGGLAEEAEDIRIHMLSREQALGLIRTGEICILPLIGMLYWLDRNRRSLSAPA